MVFEDRVRGSLSAEDGFADHRNLAKLAASRMVKAFADFNQRLALLGCRPFRTPSSTFMVPAPMSSGFCRGLDRGGDLPIHRRRQVARVRRRLHVSIAGSFTAAKFVATALGKRDAQAAMADAPTPLSLKGTHRADKVRKRLSRPPVTMWTISAFFSSREASSAADIALTGASVVGSTGLLRAPEYVKKAPYGCTLRRRHYPDLGDRVVSRLMRSRTDTFQESVDVVSFAVGGPWCPMRWSRLVLASASDHSLNAPLLQTVHGQTVTYAQLQAFLKRVSKAAGVDSGRISAAPPRWF